VSYATVSFFTRTKFPSGFDKPKKEKFMMEKFIGIYLEQEYSIEEREVFIDLINNYHDILV